MSMQSEPGFESTSDVYEDQSGRLVVPHQVVVQPAVGVVQPPVGVVPAAQTVSTSYRARFAPDAVVTALVGLVLLVVGLLAVTRAGTAGPMNAPVVKVLGFTHTETLGLIEIAIGAILLICGATLSRGGTLFFAAILGIGGFVGAVQAESFRKTLALESSMAWLVVVAAVVVVVATLAMPRYVRRSTNVTVAPY